MVLVEQTLPLWWNPWPYESGQLRQRGRNRIKTEPMMKRYRWTTLWR